MGATVSSGMGLANRPPALPPAKQNNNVVSLTHDRLIYMHLNTNFSLQIQ